MKTTTIYQCEKCEYTTDSIQDIRDHEIRCGVVDPEDITVYEYRIKLNMLDGTVSDSVDLYKSPGVLNKAQSKAIRAGQKTPLKVSFESPEYAYGWDGCRRAIIIYTIKPNLKLVSGWLYARAQELLDEHIAKLQEYGNKIHKGFLI